MPVVRAARQDDLPEILDILNREIAEGYAHFGTEAMTLEALAEEFKSSSTYPWIVLADHGRVCAFAKANPWKARGGYRRTCEVGVYVRHDEQGQGHGHRVYAALIGSLQELGFKTLLGGIALPNPGSVRLHEKLGFRHVGTLPKVGWKLQEWRDVGYWALTFPDPEME